MASKAVSGSHFQVNTLPFNYLAWLNHILPETLLKFAAKIDTARTPAARALVVVSGNGFAHRRPDGVFVIPITTLTA